MKNLQYSLICLKIQATSVSVNVMCRLIIKETYRSFFPQHDEVGQKQDSSIARGGISFLVLSSLSNLNSNAKFIQKVPSLQTNIVIMTRDSVIITVQYSEYKKNYVNSVP